MTNTCKIVQGHIHSPFFIFMRTGGQMRDEELLKLLGLDDFSTATSEIGQLQPHLFITQDEHWTHLADDWCYSLWCKGGYQLVQKLHEQIPDIPIFACSVGEADWAFDFAYYDSGKLLRRYVVEDTGYSIKTRRVVEDFGTPLPKETPLSGVGNDDQVYVLGLASGLGVNLIHDSNRIRCYAMSNWKEKEPCASSEGSSTGFAFSMLRAWRKFMGP